MPSPATPLPRVWVAIDPGATTGLVVARITPQGRIDALVGRIVMATPRHHESAPETDLRLMRTIGSAIEATLLDWHVQGPYGLVLEEPYDVSDGVGWGRGRRGAPNARRGTAFRLGVRYGLALAAAAEIGWTHASVIASYPVQGTRVRPGWMGRRRRETVLDEMRLLAHALHADPAVVRSEDCCMALGVLVHHLAQIQRPTVRPGPAR